MAVGANLFQHWITLSDTTTSSKYSVYVDDVSLFVANDVEIDEVETDCI